MTNAWWVGATASVPQNESEVRSTVEPIRHDNQTAEAQKDPEWNEFDSDESGELTGLSPRLVGSNTHDTVKYVPWWTSLASALHNVFIDQQVASSGTAAKREEAGVQGHGTMQYADALEPVIRDGAAFGNDYFVSNEAVIQDGAGEYMTPIGPENWVNALAQAQAEQSSRRAYQASQYDAFLFGG